ncbi:hypothetical protein [Brevibacillus centrosporus]|jgi:hypothetical protein|uniref:hypothetical protein n=1 Tax=Brevibacillus centrosporus TaxID=54910 RepID=UPI003986DB36
MDQAILLRDEIQRLQELTREYQRKLLALQKNCAHQFQETALSRTCVKCLLTESLYY